MSVKDSIENLSQKIFQFLLCLPQNDLTKKTRTIYQRRLEHSRYT